MFIENNDPVENISDLMPSPVIKIGEQDFKLSFEEVSRSILNTLSR